MMNDFLIVIGLTFAFFVVMLISAVAFKMRRRGMSTASKIRVAKAWDHAIDVRDPAMRVMEADKVLDLALTELGFTGTLGDKLKKAGPRFSNVNAVWNAHKLRNTLAHETGANASDAEISLAMRTFERALKDLGA